VTESAARAAYAYTTAFVDELARSGVRHVCIAPGSRSTPLAIAIAEHDSLRTWMHLDERSAGFFALGMARVLDAPVALLCTSGTAAANFLPAVVEARRAGVPLLVLTADRPPELRDVGAAQTIDQNGLYGVHAKWFVDAALPEATPQLLRYARTLACRAVALAAEEPAGPVHLNFPFREPLLPERMDAPPDLAAADALAWHGRPGGEPWVSVPRVPRVLDDADVQRLAARLRDASRPLLVCGPQPRAALAGPLGALARALGAPLLADPLSQLRWGTHDRTAVVDRYDAMLRHEETTRALAPDLVLRFGALPTSKSLLLFLQRNAEASQVVAGTMGWSDPLLSADEMIPAEGVLLCERLLAALGNTNGRRSTAAWLRAWRDADERVGAALAAYAASATEPFEGGALAATAAALPAGASLFVSSSMPVRDLDAFAPGDARALRVLANRGANGIDGVVSTALGAAAAGRERREGPLVLVIGDLAFYHDMNGLLAAKLHGLDATIVVLNNDGGGIFSFLPQAARKEHFELLFGTPHGLAFEPAARLYGARYAEVTSVEALREAVVAGIGAGGLQIVEMRTDRARNVALHGEAWAAVARALGRAAVRAG
jgi:2-succinyl-5-enolpyruvyl-6-hydroxy-3-cyclohexene-1-carboxylate synthase